LRVSLNNSPRSFSAEPEQSLLDAALDAALNLPHSCKGGNCGSCRARLLQGEIRYPNGAPLGLSAAEVAEGLILLCQARALTDLRIETFDMQRADQAAIKRLPCRIERALALSPDVMQLLLRLPAAEDFSFQPGQYVDILLPGGRRRSFSIASPPHDSRLLELHVRRVTGGEFSASLFRAETHNSLLNIEGPLGQFVYRSTDAPLLLIGGGTGLAPLLCMLRHIIETGGKRDIQLYWGVREEQDLYAHAVLENLVRRVALSSSAQNNVTPNSAGSTSAGSTSAGSTSAGSTSAGSNSSLRLRYVPVLSEASPAWRGRTGWVHDAALADIENLETYEVYAAGPPAMIAGVRREFALRGADPTRIFSDSFDYALDTLERQRISAATKS